MGIFNTFFEAKDLSKTLKENIEELKSKIGGSDLSTFKQRMKVQSKKAIENLNDFLNKDCTAKTATNSILAVYAVHNNLKKELSEIKELELKIEKTETKVLEKLKIIIYKNNKDFKEKIFSIKKGYALAGHSLGLPAFPKGVMGLIYVKETTIHIEFNSDLIIFSSDVGETIFKENLKQLKIVKLNEIIAVYFKKNNVYIRKKIIIISKLTHSPKEISLADSARGVNV